jgi:AraC-like DNA-binding protein
MNLPPHIHQRPEEELLANFIKIEGQINIFSVSLRKNFSPYTFFVMQPSNNKPALPALTKVNSLNTLVENRTIYNLENCELNLFETYQQADLVSLKFNDLVVTSMLRGKKIMHLYENEGFEYVPGQSVLIPSSVEMKIDFPEAELNNPTQCLALAIDNKKIMQTLDFLNEKYPKEGVNNYWTLDERNFFFYNNPELAQTINKLITICQSPHLTKDVLADLALQELIVQISQSQNVTKLSQDRPLEQNAYLTEIIAYIQANLSEKINLQGIANKVGLSTASFYRLFKRELGISPLEYIILERIKRAKQLLQDQNAYIKNVSYETGFEDSNYFIRAFKLHEGITPKQYQMLNRSK